MKHIISLCALLSLSALLWGQAQQHKVSVSEVRPQAATQAEKYAEIAFDTLHHDFGAFSKSQPVVRCVFPFRNRGTAPLIIHQAFASCGCTVPEYPKRPVMPGQRDTIVVTYDGTDKFPGHFQKVITVRTNSREELLRLTIEGVME